MDNIDGRKIPDPVREQIRFEAIENWLAGMTPTRLAHKYGTSRKIVYQWIDLQNRWLGRPENKRPKFRNYCFLWTCQIIVSFQVKCVQMNFSKNLVGSQQDEKKS